ncbi:MAG: RNA polymerase sigma factor, partial [Acidobacteriota bacterium]|nr:RNA polymerase sigma factor [Acidobacteriota bacterium]
ESIYRHFKSRLFSLAYRYTYNPAAAEDILQDTFVKVFTNLSSLEGEKTFIGWLYRITINNCLTYIREKKKHLQRTVPLNDVEHTMSGKKKPAHEKRISKSLEKAIETLPTKLKSVFLLYDVQGFKHEEVAEILGCAVGTSKSQLFKARMKIRKYLEKNKII